MRMTHTQLSRIAALLDSAEMAATEEREFWNDQTVTEDHRPPDWLGMMESRLASVIEETGARRVGRGWAIPVADDLPNTVISARGEVKTLPCPC